MEQRPADLDHLKWLRKAGIVSFQGKSVLDLGCGSGYLCHFAMLEGAKHAVGVDIINPGFPPENGWEFQKADLNSDTWAESLGSNHDLVLAFDIIEHVNSPFLFLTHCRKRLSKQGTLILTTPNTLSWERFTRPKSWSGVSDPQHKVLFEKLSLLHLLKQSGFQLETWAAPMRSLAFLGPLAPQWGGQMLCVAKQGPPPQYPISGERRFPSPPEPPLPISNPLLSLFRFHRRQGRNFFYVFFLRP